MAKKSNTDFAKQKSAIIGRFAKDDTLTLEWMPEYIKEFPVVVKNVPLPLKWEKCKFVKAAQNLVPEKFGVYCFSIVLGDPFPKDFHLPLYIGKASDQYLSERFVDYFGERGRVEGREKVVVMLNRYRGQLFFWWAEVQGAYVSMVESHLLMCCNPPCNDKRPNREKLWGKAFDYLDSRRNTNARLCTSIKSSYGRLDILCHRYEAWESCKRVQLGRGDSCT